MDYQSVVNVFLQTSADQWERISTNGDYAFCKEDVNLRIVCNLDEEDIQQEDFQEPWANNFPNPSATGYYYNLYYGSTLLRRFILVSVDGGRALLPLPEIGTMEVSQAELKVAEIFDTTGALAEYLNRVGMSHGILTGM